MSHYEMTLNDNTAKENEFETIVEVCDRMALSNPKDVFITYSTSLNMDSWQDISWSAFTCAVDKTAHWIDNTLGHLPVNAHSRPVVAYMGTNDVRYILFLLGAKKAGYTLLFTSPRNSLQGYLHLLKMTECQAFMYSSELVGLIKPIASAYDTVSYVQVPTLEDLLTSDPDDHIRYPLGKQGGPDDIVQIMHTSGTTGLPKPVNWTNRFLYQWKIWLDFQAASAAFRPLPVIAKRKVLLHAAPMFHTAGVFITLYSIYNQATVCMPVSGRFATAEMIVKGINAKLPGVLVLPPSILEDIVDVPGGLNALSSLEFCLISAAALSPQVGDRIRQHTVLHNQLGSTEGGMISLFYPDAKEDWQYFEWAPENGIDMQHAGNELYEMVIKKNGTNIQPVFLCFPELHEFRTKDLFAKHPTKKGLWRYSGRSDDVLVLSNGEKVNPVELEKALEGSPLVQGALAVGADHFQIGLILEPSTTGLALCQDKSLYIDEIWPWIENANKNLPGHAQVYKSKIAIAHPEKPFARAAKGSVIRRDTVALYEAEIKVLFSNETFVKDLVPISSPARTEVYQFVRKALELISPAALSELQDDTDFFTSAIALDSLQLLSLSSMINHSLSQRGSRVITLRDIYQHPTINGLITTIQRQLLGVNTSDPIDDTFRTSTMQDLVLKYTAGLVRPAHEGVTNSADSLVFVLTGSTGQLGGYILERLLTSSKVSKIFCLNRDTHARERQIASFRGRNSNLDLSKCEFLQADFSKPCFGLSAPDYATLLDRVDCIVHNAWPVNFNQALVSFEGTHIAGTRHFIDFSRLSKRGTHLVFVSSVTSVANWLSSGRSGAVPEEHIMDYNLPMRIGYGESKHVAAQILVDAAQTTGISCTILRCGQLAGSTEPGGLWKKQEWVPSLLQASKVLAKLPLAVNAQTEGTFLDWIPIDKAASAICEITLSRLSLTSPKSATFNIVNPKMTTWSSLLPSIQRYYDEQGVATELVEYEVWFEALQDLSRTRPEMKHINAMPLLDFFESLKLVNNAPPTFETRNSMQASVTLSQLEPLKESLMAKWLKEWDF